MTQQIKDDTGAAVTIRLQDVRPVGTYTVNLADGSVVGRAEFVRPSAVDDERIFFHTEVDQKFGGRGLARLLVREVLEDSIRTNITVVPVCPLFAAHLREHGDEFVAMGGKFRRPRPADLQLVTRTARRDEGHAIADT
ncbi:GNAT family N-acetyltransferase [Nocardioides houyundeii]|uniref:GNAT family N-acetyltransferase n=1 Tax=Nocardioides houyundeii TaxID=2045452 RepID=UPI000DF3379D|nr:GNAT family N-acetyltransferase [Nocardioides houyundeii]